MSIRKNAACVLLCALLALGPVAIDAETPPLGAVTVSETVYMAVYEGHLYAQMDLRSEPASQEVPLLAPLRVLSRDGAWLYVDTGDAEGYVPIYFVALSYENLRIAGPFVVYATVTATTGTLGGLSIGFSFSDQDVIILQRYENGRALALLPATQGKGFIQLDELADSLATEPFTGEAEMYLHILDIAPIYETPAYSAPLVGYVPGLVALDTTAPQSGWVYVPEYAGYIPYGATTPEVAYLQEEDQYFVNAFATLDAQDGFGTAIALRVSEGALIFPDDDAHVTSTAARIALASGIKGFWIPRNEWP